MDSYEGGGPLSVSPSTLPLVMAKIWLMCLDMTASKAGELDIRTENAIRIYNQRFKRMLNTLLLLKEKFCPRCHRHVEQADHLRSRHQRENRQNAPDQGGGEDASRIPGRSCSAGRKDGNRTTKM